MKAYGHIAFFMVLACLTACTHGVVETRHGTSLRATTPSPALSSVDSLMWVQPDSALACLLSYFDTCCRDGVHTVSTYNRHYAHLLLSELLYKNDYAQTNRAELLDAVAYFDSLCDAARHVSTNIAFLDARAHYINGVGYYEHDSVVPACQEYMKALEVMEERFKEEELVGKKAKFMALTHTHLSGLFSDIYLHEQAIYYGNLSLEYYQKYDAEPWHIAWMMNKIGSRYEILENYDSAYYYYHQGLMILPDTNNLMYRDIATHLASLSYSKEQSNLESLKQLIVLKSNAKSEKEYCQRCLAVGEVFYQETQYDSAWLYYKKVFDFTQNEGSKKLAAERLVAICKIKGLESETTEYIEYLLPFANQEEVKSTIKSQLTELYKSYTICKTEQLHKKEKKKNLIGTLGVIIGSFCLLSIILFLYRMNKKKRKHLEKQIKEERFTHKIQQKSLAGRLKRKSQEIQKLQDQIKQRDDSCSETAPVISFDEEPICRLIIDRVKVGQFKSQMDCIIYKDFALDKNQMMALHEAVDQHFVGFSSCLKKNYPQLTNSDLDYCCLYLLGLTDADIAALLQKAYPTVSQRSRKLKAIFGNEKPLPITLYGFANNGLSC